MMDKETKEMLGIAPTDIPVYLSLAAIGGMYFLKNLTLDIVLSVVAIGFAVLGWVLMSRNDSELSEVMNFIKKVSGPLYLLIAVVLVVVNFVIWNR